MSDARFAGRVALVTGAGHGIGRAVAQAFASAGAAVAVVDIDAARADAVAAEIVAAGGRALAAACDVRDAAAVRAMVAAVEAGLGPIDILVNNAGIYPNAPLLTMAEAEWDAVFDTNVKGMFLVTQTVAAAMTARGLQGGRIVNMSSGAGVSGRAGASHYCSSKAAINMMTKVWALELTPLGITVNAVAPGLIEVPGWSHSQQYIDAIVNATPARRIGQPEDVARVVLFVADPDSTFMSGSVVTVDGGSGAGRTSLPLSNRDAAQQ
jgi:3-oxoacyl-[acyl-carrier protein] reductase